MTRTSDYIISSDRVSCLDCKGKLYVTSTNLFDTRFDTPGLYTSARCCSCNLEQLTPLPTQDELKHLYENYYNYGGEQNTAYTSIRHRFLFSPIYRLWMAIDGDISFHSMTGKGRLLDVGCNEGRGLQFYRRNGWYAEGLELNENAASEARRHGFVVYSGLIDNYVPTLLYDVVILSNVLEHSLNPREMLIQVKRLLKPGGKVLISCPNGNSIFRQIFGRFWINWHVPFHIVQFDSLTLQNLILHAGLLPKKIRNESPALWVAHSIVVGLSTTLKQPNKLLRTPLLIMFLLLIIRGIGFPLLWLFNRIGRGDCLVVTSVKPELCAS